MGHGDKDDTNIFYHLRGDNLLLYMPFPSVGELAQYKITHGGNPSEYETKFFNSAYTPITEEYLSSFRDWFLKYYGFEKQTKSDDLPFSYTSPYGCPSNIGLPEIIDLNLEPDLIFSREIPNDSQDRIKRYLKDNYPINYENIKNDHYELDCLNYLDDSVWSTESVYIKGYEYLLVKFELGYAAKTIFENYRYLLIDDSGGHHEFWEGMYGPLEMEQFYDEFQCNDILLFDLRDVEYKDVLEWEIENKHLL